MKANTAVQDVVQNLLNLFEEDASLIAPSLRLLKLIPQVLTSWKEDKQISDIGVLTDAEFLAEFVVAGAIKGSLDTRENRKLARRAEARVRFFDSLSKFGGVYKVKRVAELLGTTRQTVNNHISSGKIIAIKESNDYQIPAFQFDEKGKRPHLEEILEILKGKSSEALCSFFLNPIEVDGHAQVLPYELLNSKQANKYLDLIKREANLFLSQTAS